MTTTAETLPEAEVIVEIPFHDVDLLEVAWHGHYAKYFEIARGALLDTIDYNYREMRDSGYAWPVIELKVRYVQPGRFGQKIKVKAFMTEYELRLKIDYLITDAETGDRLTKAHTVQAAVDMATQELLLASPPVLLEKLGIDPCD
jgi:acyl-CoA thioester hydrolase